MELYFWSITFRKHLTFRTFNIWFELWALRSDFIHFSWHAHHNRIGWTTSNAECRWFSTLGHVALNTIRKEEKQIYDKTREIYSELDTYMTGIMLQRQHDLTVLFFCFQPLFESYNEQQRSTTFHCGWLLWLPWWSPWQVMANSHNGGDKIYTLFIYSVILCVGKILIPAQNFVFTELQWFKVPSCCIVLCTVTLLVQWMYLHGFTSATFLDLCIVSNVG